MNGDGNLCFLQSPWREAARATAAEVAKRPAPPSSREARLARIDAICGAMERLLDEARGLLDEARAK